MLKRCFDFTCALLLLVLASPTFLLCAILIKLDSKGPIFFHQLRMGRNFRPFALLKLRTMEDHSKGTAVTLGPDPRITHIGRWLRKYKLDELPQLWNVIRGDMSLVGPRPVILALTSEFRRDYERLLTVRPGLTDPATLKYYRECEILAVSPNPLHYFKTVVTPDKLVISAAYLEHATFWSDLGLLARTAKVLLPHISKVQVVGVAPIARGRSSNVFEIWPAINDARQVRGTVDLYAGAQEESVPGAAMSGSGPRRSGKPVPILAALLRASASRSQTPRPPVSAP